MATPMHRIGFGTDIHRLQPGNGIKLAGLVVPADIATEAHSDGDVALHALTDAVLGALAVGDIGDFFPDTAPENRGRDSAEFLREALRRMRAMGWEIANCDLVIHLQQPRLGPWKNAMRQRVAEICGCSANEIGLQAKSGESMDAVGRGEAVAAQAVILLRPAVEKT